MSANTAPRLEEVRAKRSQIMRALEAQGARNPRVFGSVARGDAVPESDVDLLVEFDREPPAGFDYFGMVFDLQEELAKILGRPVHVVEVTVRSPAAERILREALPL